MWEHGCLQDLGLKFKFRNVTKDKYKLQVSQSLYNKENICSINWSPNVTCVTYIVRHSVCS